MICRRRINKPVVVCQNRIFECQFASVFILGSEEIIFYILECACVDARNSDRARNTEIQNFDQGRIVARHSDLLPTVQRTRSHTVRKRSLINIRARPAIDVHRDPCWNHRRRTPITADSIHGARKKRSACQHVRKIAYPSAHRGDHTRRRAEIVSRLVAEPIHLHKQITLTHERSHRR